MILIECQDWYPEQKLTICLYVRHGQLKKIALPISIPQDHKCPLPHWQTASFFVVNIDFLCSVTIK